MGQWGVFGKSILGKETENKKTQPSCWLGDKSAFMPVCSPTPFLRYFLFRPLALA